MFTKTELEIIKKTIKLQGIASIVKERTGSCSRTFVRQVLKGERNPNAEKATVVINLVSKILNALSDESE